MLHKPSFQNSEMPRLPTAIVTLKFFICVAFSIFCTTLFVFYCSAETSHEELALAQLLEPDAHPGGAHLNSVRKLSFFEGPEGSIKKEPSHASPKHLFDPTENGSTA